jgi:Rha family phage regulatory protein
MELTIIKQNGSAYLDSREVAETIGKNHKELLRDIRKYIGILEKIGQRNFAPSDFFVESSYTNTQNKPMPCYLLSKSGCELVANKLIGERGVLFTAAYVTKFNRMEQAEREREIAAYNKPRLAEFNYAVRNVLNGMTYTYAEPHKIMSFLNGVYQPLGVKVLQEGDGSGYYSATEIARLYNIFSATGRPHSHAVAAIISKLDFPIEGHAAVVPYNLVGFSVRYDATIAYAVYEWLNENNFPNKIPYLDFDYHICYHRQNSLFEPVDDLEFENYTAEELNEMCGKYGGCNTCPGLPACCEDLD